MPTELELLAGRRVLIVEDRYLIASELAREVARLGGEVLGPSRSVAAAAPMVDRADLALLDVNLEDEMVFPVASALASQGVPFIFLTGYERDTLPPEWRDRPVIRKPIDLRALRQELARLSPAAKPGKRRS